jgi:hypothetical protein
MLVFSLAYSVGCFHGNTPFFKVGVLPYFALNNSHDLVVSTERAISKINSVNIKIPGIQGYL